MVERAPQESRKEAHTSAKTRRNMLTTSMRRPFRQSLRVQLECSTRVRWNDLTEMCDNRCWKDGAFCKNLSVAEVVDAWGHEDSRKCQDRGCTEAHTEDNVYNTFLSAEEEGEGCRADGESSFNSFSGASPAEQEPPNWVVRTSQTLDASSIQQ